MTFASLPGSEIISSKPLKVGSFIIKTHIDSTISKPIINWCINEKVNTILTGSNFNNISNPDNFATQDEMQVPVTNLTASSTVSPSSVYNLIDGKGSSSGTNSVWKTDQMPAQLIFSLDNEYEITKTKIEFNNWQNGSIYQYSIYFSSDTNNWNEVVSNASSDSTEWTVNNYNKQRAKYIKISITGNNKDEWIKLWEVQIYGSTNNVATNVV